MKKTILILLCLISGLADAQNTFNWESLNEFDPAEETVAGVIASVTQNGLQNEAFNYNYGIGAIAIFANAGSSDGMTVTFSQAIDVASITLIDDDTGTPNSTTLTPTGGSNTAVTQTINNWQNNPSYSTVKVNWSNVTSFTISSVPAGNFLVLDDIVWYPAGTLAITLGSFNATLTGNNFLVNWTTLTETNNASFDIQVSADGKTFHSVGTVQSQAPGGNSEESLHYRFEINYKQAAGVMGGAAVLLLLGVAFPIRRKTKMLAVAAAVLLGSVAISCAKKDVLPAADNNPVYVRIVQTDIDGTKTYTKVIKATRQ
ncbi:hypothetical protein [Niabella ginsengisoli]|uniref:Uncharacterized protein n=1 Tax=Niabella ginsengisoli TaxID=522298 RepID=A0ABS9SFV8_9BACT|nr:hypothetical protein [Niabella ginsengisoli]MCH5597064.1 hypothetical protein [Niabella ginsengisoli]